MDWNAVGNDFVHKGVFTFHVCGRCIDFFANGNFEFLGKVGCCMPDPEDAGSRLYASWSVAGKDGEPIEYRRCFRCFVLGQECVALPDDMIPELKELAGLLTEVRDRKRLRMVPNPDHVPAQGDNPAVGPKYSRTYVDLDDEDVELVGFKIQKLCKPLNKRLNRELIPHAQHLFLHSGAIGKQYEQSSCIRPGGRKRDTKTLAAKNEAAKRTLEHMVDAQVQQELQGDGTPKKKARHGRIDIKHSKADEDRMQAIPGEIAALKADRDKAKGKGTKPPYTLAIKELEKELAALKAKTAG